MQKKVLIELEQLLKEGKIRILKEFVSEEMINDDLVRLKKKVYHKKQIKRIVYWSVSAAACILLFFSIRHVAFFLEKQTDKAEMLGMIQNMSIDASDNVTVIVGNKEKVAADKDVNISQDEEGALLVNSEKVADVKEKKSEIVQVIVPRGKRSSVKFSDGSVAWLNSGSKLVYPSEFEKKSRDIYVEGEIYIEVSKNESCPFFVRTKDLDIKVLGTIFNVTAYREDNYSNVVLVRGSVEVTTSKKQKNLLKPNNYFHYEDGKSSVTNVDIYDYICWKDGIMKLNNEPLSEIFKRLSRYYNVNIIFNSNRTDLLYKGKLNLNGTLKDVLRNISFSEPIKYSYAKDTYIVTL